MMKMKTKPTGLSRMNGSSGGGVGEPVAGEWELRPGGMLVQKRDPDSDRLSAPAPTIRIRVKYGSTYHEISISSQATFGELKKMLSGPTGLHHLDQKLIYKNKERDSKAFLDIAGVKDKSKVVLLEDPISQEKRYLEMRRSAKMEKDSKSISQISLEVDKLAVKVADLESTISRGQKVAETDVLNLIELLMNQLVKLDGITADGDVKLQRKMQVRRVQKYVETLDLLKIKNSMPNQNQKAQSNGQRLAPIQEHQPRHNPTNGHLSGNQHHQYEHATPPGTVVTTNWELFDPSPAPSTPTAAPINQNNHTTTTHNDSVHPKFPWEFFD